MESSDVADLNVDENQKEKEIETENAKANEKDKIVYRICSYIEQNDIKHIETLLEIDNATVRLIFDIFQDLTYC